MMPRNSRFCRMGLAVLLCVGITGFAQRSGSDTCRLSEIDINGMVFRIDPRIELLYTVGLIGDYPAMNRWDMEYKDEVREAFLPYQNHEVVRYWQEIGPKGFAGDGPVFTMLRQMPEPDKWTRSAEVLGKPVEGENRYEKFCRLLEKFARDTKYCTFYNNHRDYYNLILSNVAYTFRDYNEIRRMEQYFGQSQQHYTVIINLMGSGNFAPRIKTPNGLDIYCVMEPQACCGNIPMFNRPIEFDFIVLHEFSHSFINPLVDQYRETVDRYASLYEPIASSMRHQGYHSWDVAVKEHLVNAVTARMAAGKYGEERIALTYGKVYTASRYLYINPLCEKLRDYESSRDQYPALKDFFPELLSAFEDISKADIAALQQEVQEARKPDVKSICHPMNGFDKDHTVLIEPTHEKDKSQQDKLHSAIGQYRSWFYPNAQILTDMEVLKADLTECDIIVFGTPGGNLFLQKYINELPMAIGKTQLVADKIYPGGQYQLVTGWVNPVNPQRKMTIYTAQNTALVNSINEVSLGNSHYVIAKANRPVKYGNYKRVMGAWVCE